MHRQEYSAWHLHRQWHWKCLSPWWDRPIVQAQASTCKLTVSRQNWPRQFVREPKAWEIIMYSPSQSWHTSSDCQFPKDQPEMFQQQLSFPNPIKTPTCLQWKAFVLESSRVCVFDFAFSHALPAPETGTACRQQQQEASKCYTPIYILLSCLQSQNTKNGGALCLLLQGQTILCSSV